MNIRNNIKILALLAFSALMASCGDKLDLSQFPLNEGGNPNVGDVVYVQISPTWDQFNAPRSVYIGKEPLVYVADTKNNRVVQLDLSGSELGTKAFLNPTEIAQDYNFNLYVIADSVAGVDTINVVYKVNLFESGGFLTNSVSLPVLTSDYPTPTTNRRRKFTGISIYPNNKLLVTRVGPNNTNIIDPDNAILKATINNNLPSVEVLSGFQTTGNGIYSIDKTSGVTTFDNSSTDFIIIRNTTDFGFKVEWFVYDNLKGTYDPRFLPENNVDILNKQLGTPSGITVDPNRSIYVVDDSRDSLFKYDASGSFKSESFGGRGSGDNKLNSPGGVSFFNRVLYIADTGNNRITRYKLSTDLN